MIQGDSPVKRDALSVFEGTSAKTTPQSHIIDRRPPTAADDMGELTFTRPKLANDEVRLGRTVVEANGYAIDDQPVVIVQNFLPSLRKKGGFPIQIDSEPDDNKSTNHLAVPCLGDNEVALTTTLPPGLAQYYVERGLIKSTEQVVSFNGDLATKGTIGFPHFDPVTLALKERPDLGKGYFVSAFTSEYIREQAIELGLRPVQQSDSYLTNDKVGFGSFASIYDYSVCPRVALRKPSDIELAVERFKDTPVWVKYSHAFGGDLLMKVEAPATSEKLHEAVQRMYRSVQQAAKVNDYSGVTIDTLWPHDSVLPACGGITIEQDARHLDGFRTAGKVLCTGSNLMQLNSDGTAHVRGYFEQIVGPAGDFWGSCAFDPLKKFGPSMKAELDRQFHAIARYAREQLDLYGLVGVDFMIIQRPDGKIRPVMIELNGRPPISACSHIVGTEKLKAPFWVSRYMWTPNNLHSAADFEAVVTVNGKNYARTSPDEGAVIPMYLASVTHKDAAGNPSVVIAKNWAQILVAGRDKEHCEEIFRVLQTEKGIHFTRPNSGSW
jgi:hypothetical protein